MSGSQRQYFVQDNYFVLRTTKKTSTNTFQLHDIYRYTVVYIPIHSHKHNATDAVSAASNSQFSRIDVQI